eukprot:4551308-Amphidinium_carterae.1
MQEAEASVCMAAGQKQWDTDIQVVKSSRNHLVDFHVLMLHGMQVSLAYAWVGHYAELDHVKVLGSDSVKFPMLESEGLGQLCRMQDQPPAVRSLGCVLEVAAISGSLHNIRKPSLLSWEGSVGKSLNAVSDALSGKSFGSDAQRKHTVDSSIGLDILPLFRGGGGPHTLANDVRKHCVGQRVFPLFQGGGGQYGPQGIAKDAQSVGKLIGLCRDANPRFTTAQVKAILAAAPKLQRLLAKSPSKAE